MYLSVQLDIVNIVFCCVIRGLKEKNPFPHNRRTTRLQIAFTSRMYQAPPVGINEVVGAFFVF